MSMEGLPTEQERVELIPEGEAQESYISGNRERFNEWVDQEQERVRVYSEKIGNPTYAQLFFELKLAKIQFAAGEKDDAIERFKDLLERAWRDAEELERQSFADKTQEDERLYRLKQMRDFEAGCETLLREVESEKS